MAGGAGDTTVENTPTWVVAVVCAVIIAVSLIAERILHFLGKYFLRKKQKPLFEALQKIKEELMLLGFISLLLTMGQDWILKICIPKHWANEWLPCKYKSTYSKKYGRSQYSSLIFGAGRRLLAASSDSASHCEAKGKVSLLSITALHHLHYFIFVLAAVHFVFSALTIVFSTLKIRQWKSWEESIAEKPQDVLKTITNVKKHAFIQGRGFLGITKLSSLLGWLRSFFKHFAGSVTKSDYTTLRLGFITAHCHGNQKYDFYKYMTRALEADFKKVVGIRWYLWSFVVLFLLLNVSGWNALFWISLVPLILLLAVGTKLEHIITQLAQRVADKHTAVEGDLTIEPSDDHFWFNKPRFVLVLIHIILFTNSFELAYIIWILMQYKYTSCIVGTKSFLIIRIIIGLFVQFLCSYSTLPLYAIVSQMGSSFNKAIFEEHIQVGLVGWAKKVKHKKNSSKQVTSNEDSSTRHNDGSRPHDGGKNGEIEIAIDPINEPQVRLGINSNR